MIGYGKRVLLVHDPETTHLPLVATLQQEGFVVVEAPDGIRALCEMQIRQFDVVVTDYHLPDATGLDLLKQLQIAWPEIPVIQFTETGWGKCGMASVLEPFAWVRKSSDLGILLSMLAWAMEQRTAQESVPALAKVRA